MHIINHSYLIAAITLAVYSQCIIRWRLQFHANMPDEFMEKLIFMSKFLLDLWVISSIIATFFAGIFWVISLSKFELNYAYPWMALIFIIMMFMGNILFGETLTFPKIIGTVLVAIGLVIIARG